MYGKMIKVEENFVLVEREENSLFPIDWTADKTKNQHTQSEMDYLSWFVSIDWERKMGAHAILHFWNPTKHIL